MQTQLGNKKKRVIQSNSDAESLMNCTDAGRQLKRFCQVKLFRGDKAIIWGSVAGGGNPSFSLYSNLGVTLSKLFIRLMQTTGPTAPVLADQKQTASCVPDILHH